MCNIWLTDAEHPYSYVGRLACTPVEEEVCACVQGHMIPKTGKCRNTMFIVHIVTSKKEA